MASGLLISILEKLFDQYNITGAIDVGSVFEGKSSFKMLGLSFSSKLDYGSYIICILKTVTKKIELDLFYDVFFS